MIALLVIALLAQSPGGDPTRPTPGSGFFHGFDPSYDPPEDVQADLVKGRDAYYQMTPGKDGKVTEPTQVLRYNLVPSRDEVPQTFTLPSGKTWNVWRHARFGSSATRACYWYLGLEMMYRASSMIAGMTTNFRQASDFRNLVGFNLIARLDVVIIFNADTTFSTALHIVDIVFEATQRF